MSKMGQELEDRLDANKYEMYEVLKDIADFLHYVPCHLVSCTCTDKTALDNKTRQVLTKIEGGKLC